MQLNKAHRNFNPIIFLTSFFFLCIGDRVFQFYSIFFIFENHPSLIVLLTVSTLIGNILAFPLFKVMKPILGDHLLFILALIVKLICYLSIPYFFEKTLYISFIILAIESFMDIIIIPYIYSFVDKKAMGSFYKSAARIDLIDRITLVTSPWLTAFLIKHISSSFIGVVIAFCVLITLIYFIRQKTYNVDEVSEVSGLKKTWKEKFKVNKEVKWLLVISVVTAFCVSPTLDVIIPGISLIEDTSGSGLFRFATFEFVLSITFIIANLILIKIKPQKIYVLIPIILMAFSYFLLSIDSFGAKIFSLVVLGFFFTMYKLNTLNLFKESTSSKEFSDVLVLRNSITFIAAATGRIFTSSIISLSNNLSTILIINGVLLIFVSFFMIKLIKSKKWLI